MTKDSSARGGVSRDMLTDAVTVFREHGEVMTPKEKFQTLLDTTPRTIDRIIMVLTEAGAKFEKGRYQKGTGSYKTTLRMVKGPRWDNTITPEGVLALQASLIAAEQAGMASWAEQLTAIKSRLTAGLNSKEARLLAVLETRLTVSGASSDPVCTDSEVLKTILLALGNEVGPLEIELTYQTPGGRPPKTRQVVPYAICSDAFASGAFLLAWDKSEREKPVMFRLNRILSATKTNRPGRIPDPQGIEQVRRTQIGGWGRSSKSSAFRAKVHIHDKHWPKPSTKPRPACLMLMWPSTRTVARTSLSPPAPWRARLVGCSNSGAAPRCLNLRPSVPIWPNSSARGPPFTPARHPHLSEGGHREHEKEPVCTGPGKGSRLVKGYFFANLGCWPFWRTCLR